MQLRTGAGVLSFTLLFTLLAAGLCMLGAAGVAAEGALHPAHVPVASVCPCIAHMNCRDEVVTAPDATQLRAWFYQPDVSKPEDSQGAGAAIILLHGVGASRADVVSLGYLFLQAGYSVLEPDLRGHGTSGGFTTYGLLEEQDIRQWANWMLAQPGISRIYGFGASLGGSVLLESLNREPRFRGVVAESAYADFPGIATERIRRTLPRGLGWAAYPFVESGLVWVRLRYSVRLADASALNAVRRTHVPVFLIHGLEDHNTAPENSRLIAAANPTVTTLWLVPNGGHANIWKTAGREFETRVLGWLASH